MTWFWAQKTPVVAIIPIGSLVTLTYFMGNSRNGIVPEYTIIQKQSSKNYSPTFVTLRRPLSREELTNFNNKSYIQKPRALKTGKLEIKAASASEFTWKTLSDTLSIYSSYYDTRPFRTNKGVFVKSLVIFGYERTGSRPRNLSCVVILNDSSRVLVKDLAVRLGISEMWRSEVNRYRGFLYRCNMTMLGNPQYVTLGNEVDFQNIPLASFIHVVDPRPSEGPTRGGGGVHKFDVCFGSPLHNFKYDQHIVDSIEMNRLLGATWFTLYVYEAHEKAMQILRYYHEEEEILDAVFNYGENMPNPVFYRGQLVGVNECLYRNMYKVQYLVRCDLDELIILRQSLNWQELMVNFDLFDIGLFIFKHVAFHKNKTQPTKLFSCPGKSNITYKLPPFLATHNRSANVTSGNHRCKSIAKPQFCTSVRIHYHGGMVPGYRPFVVPTNIAVTQHFRETYDWKYMTHEFTLDYGLKRFRPALLAAIEKHYCRSVNAVAG